MENFSISLLKQISEKHLLKHEFYQAWSNGAISREKLCLYAEQYYHHVNAFPRYVSAIHSKSESKKARQALLENLIDEERGEENHPELWLRFAEGMGTDRTKVETAELLPATRSLIDTFLSYTQSSYAEGLGALFAYEQQVPEIAAFKIEALRAHYDIKDVRTLAFFEVHRKADVYHSQAIAELLGELSPKEKELSSKAAEKSSHSLWNFLDAVQAA
ncbi:MAG: CADD family putative folate metabolism protein [Bdellovibrionota bacterium]